MPFKRAASGEHPSTRAAAVLYFHLKTIDRFWLNGKPIDMSAVTVSPKYQVVIPKNVRERLSLLPGDKIEVIQIGDRIELVPVKSIKSLRGFLKGNKNNWLC